MFYPPPGSDFVRAYHLTKAEFGISSVGLRQLKVARYSEVNDPFELLALKAHKHETRQLLAGNKEALDREEGLLCFSANWTNPMLWSHYADSHKGICLGFDLRRRDDVQEVLYIKERLPLESSAEKEPCLRRTKFIGWDYEQEIRKFVNLRKAHREQGLCFWPFDEDLRLTEVILGERNDLSLEGVRELTKATNPDAVVFKTRLERRGFRIVGDGNSVVRYRECADGI